MGTSLTIPQLKGALVQHNEPEITADGWKVLVHIHIHDRIILLQARTVLWM